MKTTFTKGVKRFVDGDFSLYPAPVQKPPRRPQRHQEQTPAQRFAHWYNEHGGEAFSALYRAMSTLICLGIISILLVTVSFLPPFGDPSDPVNNEVSQRYIESGLEETGAVNIVSGMILDYRAFDTFGESAVLFVASASVMLLMKKSSKTQEDEDGELEVHPEYQNMPRDPIVKMVAKYLIPFLLMFGIYVILNGHISPGGGFAGGAIMGAGLILFSSAYGFPAAHAVLTQKRLQRTTFCALSFYAIAKGYSFYTGAHHLETGIPLGTPGAILSSGLILPLNICVGIVVTCTMYSFYSLFTKGEI